jgi:exonuclease VII small subunit
MTAEQFQKQEATYEEELKQLTQVVDRIENRFEVASAGWKVLDKAFKAWQDGLKGKARNLLLDSDLAAFGTKGMALELELLLRTGRPKTVIEWMGPEKKPALGATYHPQGPEQMDLREIMTMLAGKMVLDEQAASGSLFDQLRRAHSRFEFRDRVSGLAQSLRRQADLRVLRGLIALEEGEVDEAEIAFREALSFWKDAGSAASGGGLDFNGRAIAQGYLELLE